VEAAIRADWNYIRRFHDELRARRETLHAGIAGISGLHWEPTGGGFFAFVRFQHRLGSEELAAAILDRTHVVTIPGAAFGQSGEGFLRLSYGAVGVNDLKDACDRLGGFFAS
jgi:aminotransferase